MLSGHDYLTGLVPQLLIFGLQEGEGFIAQGDATAVLDTETIILSFDNEADVPLRLARLAWWDNFGGSPVGQLFIRSDGALVEEYFTYTVHDVLPGVGVLNLEATIGPKERCEIAFLNETDSGAARPICMIVSGWLRQLEPKRRID